MDDLVAVYRAGLVALYPDGSSYGAAQFGEGNTSGGLGVDPQKDKGSDKLKRGGVGETSMIQPSTSATATAAGSRLGGVGVGVGGGGGVTGGWIEREIASIKHSYEEEMKLLESETSELRGKLRQSDKYISELRRR